MSPATAALRAEARADDLDLDTDVQDPKQASLKKEIRDGARQLAAHCAAYRGAVNSKAIWQIASTAVPFLLIVAAMIATANTNYWLTLLLAIPGGGLLVRFFTIQHDCGHGSFFTSRTANDVVGRLISVLTVTPYGLWRREHAQHHATSGHLEKRGVGDITTLTIAEFLALTPTRKFLYRLYRNPIFLFGFGVPVFFMVLQRSPWGHPYPASETWKSVMGNNAGMLVFYGTLGWFEHAPYAAILVTAGSPSVPQPLIDQLAVGGRLIIPLGDEEGQVLKRITRTESGLVEEELTECRFVKLWGKYGWVD